ILVSSRFKAGFPFVWKQRSLSAGSLFQKIELEKRASCIGEKLKRGRLKRNFQTTSSHDSDRQL
ncbi:hypothetical protein ACTHT4_11325, partial [Neisseria sp. P0022.S007]|uniref:hypothetical protein n=1 Tax=Neisseria sp. P0022.S007 TaxID=3436832 RepID=UPI003F7DF6E2